MTWPFRHRPSQAIQRPLQVPAQLLALRQAAATLASPWPRRQVVHQPQLGERPSLIRGSGLDYDESRPFLRGDDRRQINWRLYARTGELHLKLFREERRPQRCLLLDRRQGMRLGSRGRLKLTQAVRLAALLAFTAQAEQMAVAALCLEERIQFHRGRSGEIALAELLAAMAAAAPPLGAVDEPPLSQALAQLQARLPRGSQLCLISDFNDLKEEDSALLWQLVREHDVSAYHISDALEHELPAAGRLRLDAGDGSVLEVDCADAGLREAFHREMQSRHEAIRQRLERCGIAYTALRSDTDLVALLRGEGGDGH